MSESTQAQPPQYAVAKFAEESAAHEARIALAEAGLPPENIAINTDEVDPNPPTEQTEAARSSFGGAISGGFLGGLLGLMLAVLALNFPDASPVDLSRPLASIAIAVAVGGIVGAASLSLVGALSGVNVPKKDTTSSRQELARRYLVTVAGTEAQIQQAQEILRQKGAKI